MRIGKVMRSLTLLFVVSSICVSGTLEVSAQKISAAADAVTGQTLTVSKAALACCRFKSKPTAQESRPHSRAPTEHMAHGCMATNATP